MTEFESKQIQTRQQIGSSLVYRTFEFVKHANLNEGKFAYKVHADSHRLFVSELLFKDLLQRKEKAVNELKIKDVSDQRADEDGNHFVKELKARDRNTENGKLFGYLKQIAQNHGKNQQPVPSGKERIVLTIPYLLVDVENKAPDFVDPEIDEPRISLVIRDKKGKLLFAEGREYPLAYEGYDLDRSLRQYQYQKANIYFDLEPEMARKMWTGSLEVVIKSDYERYLSYYIHDMEYRLSWLSNDKETDSAEVVWSISKHLEQDYKPAQRFSKQQVREAAEYLKEIINRYDEDKGGALVQLDRKDDEFQALLNAMAAGFDFRIDPLDESLSEELGEEGITASHMLVRLRDDNLS